MSILKVNDIQRATTGSSAVIFDDPVIITTGSISASVITAGQFSSSRLIDGNIPKEKLTNDARDWINILNKPAGLLTSSAQFAQSISGSAISPSTITASGDIITTGIFSGSGANLYNIPNSALYNSSITINGTSVSLGGTRTITTAEITESNNLYYTDVRVKSKLSAEGVVSSSGQINYQSITGHPSVNTLGGDGNQSFNIGQGMFITASGGADGIVVTTDAANYTLRFKTVSGTVSSSAQIQAGLPAGLISSSTQIQPALPGGTVSSSVQYPGWVTSSTQVAWSSVNYNSGIVSSSTQVKPLLPGGTVSASAQYSGWVTASSQINTGSFSGSLLGTFTGSVLANNGVVSSSTQVQANLPAGTVSSSAQYPGWITSSTQVVQSLPVGTVSASTQFNSLTAPFTGSFTGSHTGAFTGIVNATNGIVSSSNQIQSLLPGGTVSSSAQYAGWVTASSQIDVRNTTGIATIATTGSNTFVGNQTISGSVTLTGNLTVFGTSSTLYTTSSQLNVGTNRILIGTDQVTRFGGISIIDSGSTNNSGSLYWDSVNNRFLYEDISGGNPYNSAILIAGPPNNSSLGSERGMVTGRVPVAVGDDHIDSAPQSGSIRIDFTTLRTDIENGLYITGSVTASAGFTGSFTGTHTGTFPYASLTGIPSGIISSSTQVQVLLPGGTVSSSAQYPGWVTSSAQINTGSFSGSITTASYVSPSGLPAGTLSSSNQVVWSSVNYNSGIVSSSGQVTPLLPNGTVSSSVQTVANLPAGTISSSTQFNNLNSSFTGSFTGSFAGTFPYASLTEIPSSIVSSSTQVTNFLPAGTVSSSGQINAGATANFATAVAAQLSTVHSASYLGTATTNNLSEGITNLYYTDARVKTKISTDNVHSGSYLGTATTVNLSEDPSGSNLYFTTARVIGALPTNTVSSSNQVITFLPAGTVSSSAQVNLGSAFGTASQALTASYAINVSGTLATSTDGLPEGFTNLYYLDSRVKTKLNVENVHSSSYLGTATTTNLAEGINLYFTNQRVINALPTGTVSASSQIDYNSIQNKLSSVVSSSTQVQSLLPGGTVSSSAQFNSLTSPFSGSFTGSFAGAYTGSILAAGVVSSSAQYPGWMTSSTQVVWASVPYNTGIVSSSTQVQPLLPGGTVSSSGQVDYNSITNKLSGVVSSSTQVQPLLPGGTVSQSSGTITVDGTNSIIGINTTSPSTLTKLHVNGALMVENGVTSTNAFKDGIIFAYTGGSSQYRHKIVTRHDSIAALNLIEFWVANGAATSASVLTLNGTNPSTFYNGLTVTGSLTANGTVTLQGIPSSSAQITALLPASTVSSSAQVVAGVANQTIAPSIINATGAISGASIQTSGNGIIGGTLAVTSTTTLSGNVTATATSSLSASRFTGTVSGSGNYRMVIPVGTNLYAT